ncbi:hypothetical protein IVB30_20190 [Bradyrhizobium sp. 200]|uniref:hypothetical protein n=1 Tax=Bradyrhizobium sp. 200 TaxID=2782665 RepID=UPI002000129E|nr:hypothetical protein [Bradyrhizobium sp. 200]UPJ53428.1 hypothetical protein IVB30_20190 [Bradyrhizobium sp. 200]
MMATRKNDPREPSESDASADAAPAASAGGDTPSAAETAEQKVLEREQQETFRRWLKQRYH